MRRSSGLVGVEMIVSTWPRVNVAVRRQLYARTVIAPPSPSIALPTAR